MQSTALTPEDLTREIAACLRLPLNHCHWELTTNTTACSVLSWNLQGAWTWGVQAKDLAPWPALNWRRPMPQEMIRIYPAASSATPWLTVQGPHVFMILLIWRSRVPDHSPAVASNQPRTTLERLHARVAQTYEPDLAAGMDLSAVVAKISSSGIPPTLAVPIAHQILPLHLSSSAQITGLRVSKVVPFTRDDRFWAVFEWRVGIDIDLLAIFQIDNADESNSAPNWLMHHRYGGRSMATSGSRWASTSISWTVTSLGNLKSLFGAARHILGILEIPTGDSLTLYCEIEPCIRSEEE